MWHYSSNDKLYKLDKQDPALINDIKGLLDKVDINYRDKDGDTFLHAAIQEEHQDVVRFILEKGAKIDIENNTDQTQQRDNERKHDQSSSDSNKRQKFDQDIRTSSTDHQSVEIDVEPGSGSSQQSSDRQENGKSRERVGLLTSYHGVVYQVQWMMIVALEFKKSSKRHGAVSGFKFKTEDKDVGKFDDVVWQYKDGQQMKYNFLQAKHKLDADQRITIKDLLEPKQKDPLKSDKTDKRPFALEKYFISYRDKIKTNPKYQNEENEVENLIIVTNIDLDKNFKNSFEKPESIIPVLDVINDSDIQNKKPEYWKIKKDTLPDKEKIEQILEGTYDLIKLARKLAECVLNNQPISLSIDNFLNPYSKVLEQNVIQENKFHNTFISGQGLSVQINNLREAFFQEAFTNQRKSLNTNYMINDPEALAKEIVLKIENRQSSIERRAKVIKGNIDKLAGYVLIEKNGDIQFNPKFWTASDNELPNDSLKVFRDTLKSKLTIDKLKEFNFQIKNFKTCKEILVDKDAFWEGVKSFSQKFESSTTVTSSKDLPDYSLNDIKKNIEDFFNKLVFAVNYSKESLSKVIEHKLEKHFGLIDNDYIARAFRVEIAKALDLTEEKFISTDKDVSQFFSKTKQQIDRLILIGPTLEYRAKIEDFGIAFSEEPSGLSNFLASQERQIFNLISPHKTILSSIKVYQTLKGILEYQKDDSHIFVRLGSLLRIKDHVIKAFKSKTSNNLLVIECKAAEENVDELYRLLSEVTRSSDNKKIILITQKNDPLPNKFKRDFFESNRYEEKIDEKNSLTNLTDDSQELLKKGKVIFQGKEVSLGTLVDNGSNHIIDGEVLSKLIKKNRIKIGSKVPQKSDRGSPAYNIIMPEEIKIERFKDEDIKDDLFVISEIKEEKLINLGITEEKICSFDNCDSNDKNAKQFFLLDSKDRDKNIENFETICHNYPDKMIHFIEFKDNKFMWNRYYDPNFHTDRKFYQIEIDATKLDKYVTKAGKKDDIFTVSGIKKEDFEEKYKIDKRVIALLDKLKDNPDGNKPIIILNNADKDFGDDDKLKDFNIHWLESKGTKLFWKRSKGKTSELSRLIVSESDDCFSLLDIVKGTKSTVIADSSGTGKSTTLTLLSGSYKKKKGLDWVIRVNLRDYSSEIDKLPDEYNLKKVVEFFSAIDKEGLEDTFAKNLFKHRLEKENNILLLFDGFDEISSGQKEGDTVQSADKQKKITNLLKFLKDKTTARIVVTTRPYEKEKTNLENELSILSYTFKPIENERQEFLKNFWKRSLKLKYSENEIKESQYEEFAQDLIRKFNEAINEEKSRFMGIPLHLRMLAEVHLKKFEKNRQNDDFKDLNTFDLYKEFVDRKYKIYFSEKTGLSSTGVTDADLGMLREQYEKMHKRLAFKYLFSGSAEPFKLFFSAESEGSSFIENKMPNEEKTRELKRIGITQSRSKDDIDFVHRTFAEYFVSKLIYERLKQKLENPNYSQESKDEMRKFLLNPIFIIKENNVIRSFINSELADKSANLENFWSGQIDPLKNTEQLLLAVKEGLGNIFSFLLHSEKDKGINKKLISVPRKHIEKLCDDGEYREADLFLGALKFLIEELGKDHLEIAIMQRYLGNSYGNLAKNTKDKSKKNKLFNKKKEFLEKALSTFEKHLVVAEKRDAKHQEDYLQQASSTFEEDLKSIRAQTAGNLENQRKVWIRVLEIEIAKAKRNLANAYGDLAESPDSQGFLKEKRELLEKEILPTFEKYLEDPKVKAEKKLFKTLKVQKAKAKRNLGNVYGKLGDHQKEKGMLEEALKILEEEFEEIESPKLDIAETKRNLGNAYGTLGDHQEKKRLLEEALPYLKEHYGLFESKVTDAQKNLSKAYTKLGYPLHGAVICGNKDKVEEELKKNVNRKTDDDLVTLLHLAVREGHSDIVKLLLLEKQIDPNIKYNNKETPLDLAKNQLNHKNSQIYQEIIDILTHKSINQQQENHPVNQGSEVLSEDLGIKKV